MSKSTVCLCMIVKNESHIIQETLESVYKYIDYYVINDTGSTDNTKELIKNFFDSKGISGEIIDHEFRTCKCHGKKYKKYKWFHFGWNRSYAIEKCMGKSDYILMMDADDLIIGNLGINRILTADVYNFKLNHGSVYYRPQLFKNDPKYGWKSVGGIHEYLHASKYKTITENLEGDYIFQARTMGARSHDPNKYKNDAEFLECLLREEPKNERYVFYCAQSKYDSGDYNAAIKYYSMRIKMGGFAEEVYYSYYKIGMCKKMLGKPFSEIEQAFSRCYNYRPVRFEPLYEIIFMYRSKDMFKEAFEYVDKALKVQYPSNDILFVSKDIYDYKLYDEVALTLYYCGKYNLARDLWHKIIEEKLYPNDVHDRMISNLNFAKANIKTKSNVCVYVGSMDISQIGECVNMLNNTSGLHKSCDIYIFGDCVDKQRYGGFDIDNMDQFESFYTKNDIDTIIMYNTLDFFMNYHYKINKIYLWFSSLMLNNIVQMPNKGKFLLKNLMTNIDGILVGSEWHKKIVSEMYDIGVSRFYVVNNNSDNDVQTATHKFIIPYYKNIGIDYSNIINNFDKYITAKFNDAELYIYNYNGSELYGQHENIHILCEPYSKKLNDADYWLYPSTISNFEYNYPIHETNKLLYKTICITSYESSINQNISNKDICIEESFNSDQYWIQLQNKLIGMHNNPALKQKMVFVSKPSDTSEKFYDLIK